METQLIEIFCDVDDFCKEFESKWQKYLLPHSTKARGKCTMTLSEIMTIVIFFHLSNQRTFKGYYQSYISTTLKDCFPQHLSYNRFVEVMQSALVPLVVYTLHYRSGKCSGISFIDSTALAVCENQRIPSHKVFKDFAKRGKTSTGFFYGFKLHLAINDRGETLSFAITQGNVDDRKGSVVSALTKNMFGRLFADKGYISGDLFQKLFERNITLVTKVRRDMKNRLMLLSDRILLRKRAIIESVNDFLKNTCKIEHTRRRSVTHFLVNLISDISAYSFLPKKPSLNLSPEQPLLI